MFFVFSLDFCYYDSYVISRFFFSLHVLKKGTILYAKHP